MNDKITDEIQPFRAPELPDPGPSSHQQRREKVPGAASSTESKEPTLKLVRESGLVKVIEIDCSCGRKIRLDCRYAEETGSETGQQQGKPSS